MVRIRTGVVGAGHLGYHHARIYAALEHSELVGVVDTDEAKRTRAAEDFTVPGFSTIDCLIEAGAEAVSVVTPTPSHHDVVIHLLQAGIHVLVEKPMAMNVHEAQTMADVARAHHCTLQVGHIERFNGAVMALLAALHKPRFIECHRLSPYPMRSTDVSVVFDLMIHDLDVVRALDGSDVVAVDAVGVPVFSKHEDIANARLRFASGCVANLTSSRVSMDKMRKIRIFEENAYVSTDYGDQEVLVYRKAPGPVPEGANPMERIQVETLDVQRGEPLREELTAFLASVQQGRPPVVSAEDGIAALKLAERITEAIRAT